MAEYIVEMGPDGVVELPSDLQAQLGVEQGDKLVLRSQDEKILMERLPMSAFERAQVTELPKNRRI